MSRRGGGRRPEGRREQQNPAPSFQRGGGGPGRGGGGPGRGGRGRSGSLPAQSPPASYPTPTYQVQSAPSPASYSQASSSSSSAAALSQEVEERLTLQSPAPAPTPIPAPVPVQVANLPPLSSKGCRAPSRPGFGTIGQKCIVRANHFLVEVADRDLHQYDVTITPEVTSKKVNRDVMSELVRMYRESHLGKRRPAYDGRKSLYTAGPLPFISKEFVVNLVDNEAPENSARRERQFKVAIKFASKADLHHLLQFINGRQPDSPQETIQVLDVVLRESPSNNYTVSGRSFFSMDLGPTGQLGEGVEYWKGYYQSLRPTQMGLSLNIDVSARSFYEPILVHEFIQKYLNIRDLSRPLSDRDCIRVKKALKGVKVELSHREHKKSYKITSVTPQPTSQMTFPIDDQGARTSVVQYFRERYNIVLQFTSLPCLQAGTEAKPAYLPMELSRIAKGQRYTKKLSDKQVSALLRANCQRPLEREGSIKQMVRQNNFSRDVLVRDEFGIRVNEELARIEARVLPAPRLKYHETGREVNVDPRVGQWNMINKKMVNAGTVENWTCICFSTRLREDLVYRFCEELVNMCASKGMVFNPNPLIPIRASHPNQIEKALVDVHSQTTAKLVKMGQKGKQLQLLIIILPDFTGSYARIKTICETELGIVSQCCQPLQAQKLNKQYFENVALKINVKVGGRNTVLFDAIERRIPLVTDMPTIIFGADVTHPQPGDDSSPSIAAVVASMDWPEVTKYRGLVSSQAPKAEIIEDLYKVYQDPQRGLVHGGMIRDLLIAFRRSTGLKPFRIIFYRDGVSEGQFSQVLLHEMDAIRQACNSLEPDYQPPITFVVVQKRHHTRLFPDNHNNRNLTDRSGNILPGTVVDTSICHPTEFDFYLNSHAGIQGTSRPAHYHVLFDENKFTADNLQTLTNNLCYTFARCTRSVSLVPPAYYAHLAAFRARYYMEGGESSDGGSRAGGRNTREGTEAVRTLPSIKENVKDVMFYC